jgi:hypothetical protein
MLRRRKSCSGRRSLFILTFLSAIGTDIATASDDIPLGYRADRYQPIWERNPFTIVTPVTPRAQPSVFDKLVLLSWLNDGGADVVFVQNTETSEVQKITKEPNANSFRLVAIHKAANPKDADVVIANSTERGVVKFRLETVAPPPQTAGGQPAVPSAAVQNPPQGNQMPPLQGMSRQAQASRAVANQEGGAVLTQSQPQLPGLPPRASEVRRKRLTAPPATEQPVGVPTPARNLPSQPQTQ